MVNPFFSIVIANYNHGSFLEKAILSILNQNFSDYEIILIDGGSIDNSIDVIEKYKCHLSWWVSEKDNGQSNAFNKGFAKANGKFYTWLNADDILMPDTLNKVYKYCQKNPQCLWVTGNTIFYNSDERIIWCSNGLPFVKYLNKQWPVTVGSPTSFFHRNIFVEAGGFDESFHIAMDSDLWLTFFDKGYGYKRISHYCWGFQVHEQSKTSHIFTTSRTESEANEAMRLRTKHNRHDSSINAKLQFLCKLLGGYHLKSYIHTKRWKGKPIYALPFKWNSNNINTTI